MVNVFKITSWDVSEDNATKEVIKVGHKQGPDFDDMSSFIPCKINNAIQYINLEYGAQTPKIVTL